MALVAAPALQLHMAVSTGSLVPPRARAMGNLWKMLLATYPWISCCLLHTGHLKQWGQDYDLCPWAWAVPPCRSWGRAGELQGQIYSSLHWIQ